LKEETIQILQKLLDLDFNKFRRSFINSRDKELYKKFLLAIMPKIINLIDNVDLEDKIEYMNPLTDLIIYLFEIISIDELHSLGIINLILDKFMHNCDYKTLCAKALAGMSINFFESIENQNNLVSTSSSPEILQKFNEDNAFLVYVYENFSQLLLSLLNQPDTVNKAYRKDVTYALLNITYYANRKLKVLTEQFSENEKLLKSKMTFINKISLIFFEDEINSKNKQDPFMVKYFFNIFMVN